MTSYIPTTAPFNDEQRAWLNGFFAGLTGMTAEADPSGAGQAIAQATAPSFGGGNGQIVMAEREEAEDFPWHDASLPIVDRMQLAEGHTKPRRLMAAMAQLDCGSCGYLCQTYSEAIARGEETNLTLCSPGGKETKQMIKKIISETNGEPAQSVTKPTASHGHTASWSRNNPFTAKLVESRMLNLEGSAKDTRHVVIDLSGSGLQYNVGDALGVLPTNCPDLAQKLIASMAADPKLSVMSPAGQTKSLWQSLCEDYCLKDPSDELIELLIQRIANKSAKATLSRMLTEGVPEGFDVLDVFEVAHGATVTATEVLETLDPLNPRLYSIASSMKRVGDEVHLTVGKVVYEREGRVRKGVASTMLSERVTPGETLRVFVQPNHAGFTVPANPETPVIMVGPGTGIAPFVSFLQERAETNASGKNWLFFGDQHEAFDFLYRDELEAYHSSGVLTRLDTAFSRDGDHKVYVQDRMREQAAELYRWLQDGAAFYVCGDATRMAQDVHATLLQIIANEGDLSEEEARLYIDNLTREHRYLRDVY